MTPLDDLLSQHIMIWQIHITVISLVMITVAFLSALIAKQLDRLNWNGLSSQNIIVKTYCHSNTLDVLLYAQEISSWNHVMFHGVTDTTMLYRMTFMRSLPLSFSLPSASSSFLQLNKNKCHLAWSHPILA